MADAIIEDRFEAEEGRVPLSFPKVSEAFIPQAYAVLRHTSGEKHLERPETWSELSRRNDIGTFLLSYLSSPYSCETPMLILGHPGSGKSLLTKVLCARLMSKPYTPIRVPLREIDADSLIESQVDSEIQRITGNRIQNWANFSGQFLRDRWSSFWTATTSYSRPVAGYTTPISATSNIFNREKLSRAAQYVSL